MPKKNDTQVVRSGPEHCRLMAEALDEPAANFIRLGWDVEPMDGLLKAYWASTLCWSVFLNGRIAAMFGCAPGAMPGVGSPWLVTAPEIARVKLRFIRQSRPYVREMLEQYPILSAYVYRGNKPLIGWMRWMGFEFMDVSEMFARGELRAWDCRWL